ncbi:hypothetical protein FB384_002037 [Prauserella sediminis]|uniref:Uncharacterized protein n=1 Tax=Prauserella sediminis TaxID=577680 RepID=A0A839XR85_9PSEU|nr:hypothetical protein [Prauserella sediminis]MBB3663133.1 hypothetical protein [Prauserella sediminis]
MTSPAAPICGEHRRCTVGPAYVQLRVRTVDVDSGREHYREVAAETAQAALTKLGW